MNGGPMRRRDPRGLLVEDGSLENAIVKATNEAKREGDTELREGETYQEAAARLIQYGNTLTHSPEGHGYWTTARKRILDEGKIDKALELWLLDDKIYKEKALKQPDKVQQVYRAEIRRLLSVEHFSACVKPTEWGKDIRKLNILRQSMKLFGMTIDDMYLTLMEDTREPWKTVNTILGVVPIPPNDPDHLNVHKYYYDDVLNAMAEREWWLTPGRTSRCVSWSEQEAHEMVERYNTRRGFFNGAIGGQISAVGKLRVLEGLLGVLAKKIGLISQVLDGFLDDIIKIEKAIGKTADEATPLGVASFTLIAFLGSFTIFMLTR